MNWPRKTESPSIVRVEFSVSSLSRCLWQRCSSGIPGQYVPVGDTIESFAQIVDGKCDDLPEQAFYLAGNIDDVRKKAREQEMA